jgi:hypothetical protein
MTRCEKVRSTLSQGQQQQRAEEKKGSSSIQIEMMLSTAASHRALVQQSASKALAARGFSISGNRRLFASDGQNVNKVVRNRNDVVGRFGRYQEEYEESLRDSCGYWLRAASGKYVG